MTDNTRGETGFQHDQMKRLKRCPQFSLSLSLSPTTTLLSPALLSCPHPVLLHKVAFSKQPGKDSPKQLTSSRFSNARRKEIFTTRLTKQSEKIQSLLQLSVSIVESKGRICLLFSGFDNKHKYVTNISSCQIQPGRVCVDLGDSGNIVSVLSVGSYGSLSYRYKNSKNSNVVRV